MVAGSLSHWVVGSLGRWIVGSLGRWVVGSLGRWVAGCASNPVWRESLQHHDGQSFRIRRAVTLQHLRRYHRPTWAMPISTPLKSRKAKKIATEAFVPLKSQRNLIDLTEDPAQNKCATVLFHAAQVGEHRGRSRRGPDAGDKHHRAPSVGGLVGCTIHRRRCFINVPDRVFLDALLWSEARISA